MFKRSVMLAMMVATLAGCGTQGGAFAPLKPSAASPTVKVLAGAPSTLISNNGGNVKPQLLPDGATFVRYASTSNAGDVKVITFNTAVGNGKITTKQEDFLKLPFYQAALNGDADAPLLCLQEVGNAQHDAVEKLAKTNKNFTYRYIRVGVRQGNMMIIPKRYTLLEYDGEYYGLVQVKAAAKQVWDWIKPGPGEKPNFSQLSEPRSFQETKLRDNVTGKVFMLYNTHVSYEAGIMEPQAKKLFDRVAKKTKELPTIVAGDLNVRTEDTDPTPTSGAHATVRAMFGDLKDMGPVGRPPQKSNIDWVLAKGFDPISSKWYTGTSISLPGSPDALTVSDHYAEEDVIRFK